jgi:protein-disulfide isomerase
MKLTPPVNDQDHILGPLDAPVTLVEYGDYECPYCAQAHPIVQQLHRTMGNRMRFVFRHFPLAEMHPHAPHAAEAAESAGAQGQFWPMHDMLYQNQQDLEDGSLAAYAAEVGCDPERVLRDIAAETYEPKIRADFLSGVRSGVNGTPSFYINGARHDDSYDIETLLAALERAAR